MPGSTISVCNQPDEFEAALRQGGHVELLVTRHTQFRSRLIRVALPRASLLVIEESSPRISFVSPARGRVVVTAPLDRESSQIWAGTPSLAGEIVTISGGQPVHARTEGSSRTGVFCFASGDLARFAAALISPGFTVPPGVQRWRPAPSALRSLMRLQVARRSFELFYWT